MTSKLNLWRVFVQGAMFALPAAGQVPLGTSFTYQGQLRESDVPVNGVSDFQFRLFTSEMGVMPIRATEVENVNVLSGLFHAEVDFGPKAFDGAARWLEIGVRSPAGAGDYTTLSPRQPLSPTPYALRVPGLDGHSLDAADENPLDVVFVSNAGYVGIGTTTPNTLLSLGNSNADSKLLVWDGGPGSGLGFGVGPAQFRIHLASPTNRFSFLDGPAGSEIFTILGTGNVGINTNDPRVKLQVGGGIRARGGGPGAAGVLDNGYAFSGNSGDNDSGMFSSADGVLQFFTNSSERIRITATGNIGIGTPAPAKLLSVRGDMELGTNHSDYVHLRIGGGNSSGFLYGSFARFGDGIHLGYNYYADSLGTNRIVQPDGPTSRLTLGYGHAALATGGVNVPPINRIVVNQGGNVGIGTDTPQSTLHVNGGLRVASLPPGSDYFNVLWAADTKLFYYDTSSRRYKENITPLTDDFERLLDAQPVVYTRPDRPDRWEIGLIAEDLHDLGLTRLVQYDTAGRPEAVNYAKGVLYLVEIAKAQRRQLAEQQTHLAEHAVGIDRVTREVTDKLARIDALAAENAELRTRLERIEKALEERDGRR